MLAVLAAVTAIFSLLGLLLAVTLTVHRIAFDVRARRRAAAEERMRPVAFSILGGDPPPAAAPPAADLEALASLLSRYGALLQGDARTRVGEYFRSSGLVAREARALSSRRTWRRVVAAQTLGVTACAEAVPALRAALVGDPDRRVRAAAAQSLGQLGAAEAVQELAEALTFHRVPLRVAASALHSLGPSAVPALRALTRHDEGALRATACELLGLVGSPADQDVLQPRLGDPAAEVRSKAVGALGRLGAAPAIRELEAMLGDRIPFVRTAAGHALGQLRAREATAALVRQARDDSFWPAAAAAAALGHIAPDAVLALRGGGGEHLVEAADLIGLQTSRAIPRAA
jgi:HEAT repeat protein